MNTINPLGEIFELKVTDKKHYGVLPKQNEPGDFMSEFTKAIGNAVENVNDAQVRSDKLSIQMIRKPNSVDVHDVMIAAEQAQLALSMTKQVVTKVIDAYKNITSLR